MKVTPKFQNGGGFESYFTTYVPIQTEQPRREAPQHGGASSRREDSDDKGKLTEKDFFNMIKEIDGLPNEMMQLVTNLMDTFRLSNLTGADPKSLATTYLQSLYQVKIASQNKAKFDKAIENASTNGSMAEPAISMDGKLIIQDENGKLGTVKLETYFADPTKYRDRVMTVSNLAYYRQYDPSLVNNQSAFDIINNSMGYESFQKLVDQAKMNLGSSEYKSSGMFQYDAKALQGLKVIQSLQENDQVKALKAITAEGLYKYNIIDKTQLGQIEALTTYMRDVLPDRAKTWAAFKLNNPNKEQATKDLIFRYLLSGNTTAHSFDIDYKGTMDHVMGNSKSSGSDSEGEPKETFLTSLQKGQGGRYEVRRFNPGGQGDFKVSGTVYGSFLDQDGKTITDANLADLLAKTGIAGITNTRSITFGDNLINPNSLSHIAIQNNGGFWAALPCIKEGDKVIPNFELIESFDTLVQEVNKELGDKATYEERQALLEKKIQDKPELQDLLNMSGKLDTSKVAPFFIVDGLASDLNFTFNTRDGQPISDKRNPLISVTDDKEDEAYFIKVTSPEDYDAKDSILGDVLFGGHNTIYKSNVFIPIQTTNRLAAIIFSGQKIKNSTAEAIEKEYQAAEVPDMRTTDSTLLFR